MQRNADERPHSPVLSMPRILCCHAVPVLWLQTIEQEMALDMQARCSGTRHPYQFFASQVSSKGAFSLGICHAGPSLLCPTWPPRSCGCCWHRRCTCSSAYSKMPRQVAPQGLCFSWQSYRAHKGSLRLVLRCFSVWCWWSRCARGRESLVTGRGQLLSSCGACFHSPPVPQHQACPGFSATGFKCNHSRAAHARPAGSGPTLCMQHACPADSVPILCLPLARLAISGPNL